MATCTSCGGAYIEGVTCPARGDAAHTRRRPAMPRGTTRSERVVVDLTPAELVALDRAAKRQRCTRAEAIRRALDAAQVARARRAVAERTIAHEPQDRAPKGDPVPVDYTIHADGTVEKAKRRG